MVHAAVMPHAPGGLSVPTATRRSATPGAASWYQPVHVVVPSAAMPHMTLSPREMSTAFDGGLPWPSPQHEVAPEVVTPQADTYWPLTKAQLPLGATHWPHAL